MNKPLLKWPVWFSSCLRLIGVKLAESHLLVQLALHTWWNLVVFYLAFIAYKLFSVAFWTCMWPDTGSALQMPVYAVVCEERAGSVL